MTEIKIVFQEKFKQNVIVKVKNTMTAAELIAKYFKMSCASKNDKMTKRFSFNGNEISANDGSTLKELGMKDMSSLKVSKEEGMASASEVHKSQPPQPQYEAPQEEPPQEEPPQEEPPQEEPPQYEEQPPEEQPPEEQPQEYQEEQPPEEQPPEDGGEW